MKRIRQALKFACLVVIGVSFGGCASMINGSTQNIPVSTDPPGALVRVDGQGSFYTPTTLTLERKQPHTITISKEGYYQEQVSITQATSGAVAGNILLGGLIGWGVDAMTGAQYNLLPDVIHVVLKRTTGGVEEDRSMSQR